MASFSARGTSETTALPLHIPTALLELLQAAGAVLKDGGVVAVPTDTLYGLAADFSSTSALRRVIEIKGRPEEMGMPLLLADAAGLSLVAKDVPPAAWALAHRFWPGALTLVVPRSPAVSDLVTGGRDTVAVRVPNHLVPLALARELGRPITGTSANRTGQPPALTAEEARLQLGTAVDLVLQGGNTPQGVQSTIVDLTGPVPRVLRQGAISLAALHAVCPEIVQ